MHDWFYLIPLLPFVGFLIQFLSRGALGKANNYFATLLIFICHGLTWAAWKEAPIHYQGPVWIQVGDLHISFSYLFDGLSGVMTLFITGIAALIHLYSIGYMAHEENSWKFFSYLNLFTGMMLMLVLGDSLLVLFLGWEGVGLCSYLLIGYWYKEMANAQAAQKAFVANRIGDFFFLIGMFLLFQANGHSLNFLEITQLPADTPYLQAALLCLFLGACGKSAQIPLYVWLPDAMAGPTPVSALIHAATMVTSGLYLLARLSPLYEMAPDVQLIVVVIGSLTALIAALIGLTQTDIKKVLAYSTVSQLGYMFVAMGCGAFAIGIFHVFTHAFFKALLFLGSGSVIHACHDEQDMRKMGGLKGSAPITHWTMLIGCLAIAGLPGLSGFFSKEEILVATLGAGYPFLYVMMLATAVLTAFYMFRLYFLTFSGEYRGEGHPHESPWQMTLPLMLLAVGAIGAGYIHLPELLEQSKLFLNETMALGYKESPQAIHISHSILIALGIAAFILGTFFAWQRYGSGKNIPEGGLKFRNKLANLSYQKFYVDEIYEFLILTPFMNLSRLAHQFGDRILIEGLVNGLAKFTAVLGASLRLLQSGRLGHYALSMILGIAVILFYLLGKGLSL